jgi:hypothetical protein
MTWSEIEAERHDREDSLGRALRAMPPARAPRTLAPRVMAAVHARMAAPVDRTWFTWPVWAQIASVIGFVALVASVAVAWPSVEAVASRATSLETVRVASVLFRAIWQPLASWLVVGLTVTALLCATLGALLTRVALGGASR